jgi:hypothetical protein
MLMIVSNTVAIALDCVRFEVGAGPTVGISPAKVTAALDCVPFEVGAGLTAGISPAKAEAESTHTSVIAINNRFMVFLLEIEAMQKFLHQKE